MQTKLTLRIDQDIIEQAKKHASEMGKSLSQVVSDYFRLIASKEPEQHIGSFPITRSLRGILKGEVSEEDYKKYLERKYL